MLNVISNRQKSEILVGRSAVIVANFQFVNVVIINYAINTYVLNRRH